MEAYLNILLIVGAFAAVYFMSVRPQRKQQKERKELLDSVKKGDRIVTVGGIYGIVRNVREDRLTVEIASEIYVQFSRNAVNTVLRRDDKNAPRVADPGEEALVGAEREDALEDYVIEQDEN